MLVTLERNAKRFERGDHTMFLGRDYQTKPRERADVFEQALDAITQSA